MTRAEFNKLKRQWYEKLRKSGFDDIEKGYENAPFINRHALATMKTIKPGAQEHYRRCAIHLAHYKFKTRRDYWLFRWYSEGHSYRAIVPLFNKRFKCKRSIFFVHTHIKRLKREMEEAQLWVSEGDAENEALGELVEVMLNKVES